jgi:glycosyltransferase involved in cell wall biosynthesis
MKGVFFPHKPLSGGPGTFQIQMESELIKNGWTIYHEKPGPSTKIVFVVAGTRKILTLLFLKIKGVKFIHRLDGLLYAKRFDNIGITGYFRLFSINFLLNFIRKTLANHVVYQTEFVKNWWIQKYGSSGAFEYIILNGSNISDLDLQLSHFDNTKKEIEIVSVEGTLPDDDYVIRLLSFLAIQKINDKVLLITLVGSYSDKLYASLNSYSNIVFTGRLERMKVKNLLVSKDLFLSLDLNAACPNSVIEAMHTGLPIIGFDTGALREICEPSTANLLVPFEGERFKHDYTGDFSKFLTTINILCSDLNRYKESTKDYAKEHLSSETMLAKYMSIINNV